MSKKKFRKSNAKNQESTVYKQLSPAVAATFLSDILLPGKEVRTKCHVFSAEPSGYFKLTREHPDSRRSIVHSDIRLDESYSFHFYFKLR